MSNTVISETALSKLNLNADQIVAVVKTAIDVTKQVLAAATSINVHFHNANITLYVEKISNIVALIEKFMGNQNVMNLITLLLKLVSNGTQPTQAEIAGAVLGAFVG